MYFLTNFLVSSQRNKKTFCFYRFLCAVNVSRECKQWPVTGLTHSLFNLVYGALTTQPFSISYPFPSKKFFLMFLPPSKCLILHPLNPLSFFQKPQAVSHAEPSFPITRSVFLFLSFATIGTPIIPFCLATLKSTIDFRYDDHHALFFL